MFGVYVYKCLINERNNNRTKKLIFLYVYCM